MLRESAFDTLGELYPDDDSSTLLLAALGANRARLPVRGARRARDYWLAVCQEVEKGAFAFTLDDLVARAAADYPRNTALRALAGAQETAARGAGAVEGGPLRVLCLLASPRDQDPLDLDEDLRRIQLAAERSGRRVEVSARTATRTGDILPALLAVRPHVVHFAGHADHEGLVFADTVHVSATVTAQGLATAFAATGPLRCVVLSACYTGEQAEVFRTAADAVTGCTQELPDAAAILFSEGFYLGLAEGRSVREAFALGRARMALAGHDTSCLRYLDGEGDL
ncbi:effector-associated domain EAD1-containing protein [Nonomuraea sp. NPDC049152]|uniref:effector-associated domain EAD1-containing protein n=1 Tax=Nonomuraea sp. NPDC049152 TaxID=3154350 RepID=UPI0033E22CBD